jgi:hypothetical protein
LLLPELVSCNKTSGNKEDDIIEIGFKRHDDISPSLLTAVRTHSNQEKEFLLEVSLGYHPSFPKRFFNGEFGITSEDSIWVLRINVRDLKDNDIEIYDDEIKNFEDEEKYSITWTSSNINYKYSYSKIINISDISIDEGYLLIGIDLIDNNTGEAVPLNCGVWATMLFFNKQDDCIFFSSKKIK